MSIYQTLILDHAKHPRNFGHLSKCTHHGEAKNLSCGDSLSMELMIKNDTVEDIRFDGSGCAISQAAASMLSEYVKGKSTMELLTLEPKTITALLGVTLSPNRLKCALLSLETLKRALTERCHPREDSLS